MALAWFVLGLWLGYVALTVAGLGAVLSGVAVPAGVCVGVLRLPVRWVSSRRGLAWHPAAVGGWVMGLGGGAAGWGVGRVVLRGAQGCLGAVCAAGVGAPTLVGWRGGGHVRAWALGDVPQADASLFGRSWVQYPVSLAK